MVSKLREEIKQTKPFAGLEQEALLNVQRTSAYVTRAGQQILKRHGLTEPQYNVLRILRGAGIGGLRCMEIGERMISRDPDISRLMERLQYHRLLERRRDSKDRRAIYSRITDAGLKVLEELDPEMTAASHVVLGHMNAEKLKLLIELLEEVRAGGLGGGDLSHQAAQVEPCG